LPLARRASLKNALSDETGQHKRRELCKQLQPRAQIGLTLRLEGIARQASQGGQLNVRHGRKIGKEVIFGLLLGPTDWP